MPTERRGHLPLARLLTVLGLIIVTLITLKLTAFRDEGSASEGSGTPSLKGKSMAIADTTTMNLSPYAWGSLSTQNGYLAYIKNGELLSKLGVDVSEHNGEIDWSRVKGAGVQFAYIRVGYRGSHAGNVVADARFAENIVAARQAGLAVGVYFFSQAKTEEEAREEADFAAKRLANSNVEYPIAFDMEPDAEGADRISKLSGRELTAIATAFCEQCEKNGYHAIVYGNRYDLSQYDLKRLAGYGFWYAEYGSKPTSSLRFGMWQYTKTGNVDGIEREVDIDLDLTDALAREDEGKPAS